MRREHWAVMLNVINLPPDNSLSILPVSGGGREATPLLSVTPSTPPSSVIPSGLPNERSRGVSVPRVSTLPMSYLMECPCASHYVLRHVHAPSCLRPPEILTEERLLSKRHVQSRTYFDADNKLTMGRRINLDADSMAGGNTLINLGDLAKPAEVLINRVSDAIGGIAKPWQIERVAKAEAKVQAIQANARVEVSEIEQRAILRMVREQGKKQENIEAITMLSIEHLNEDAKPEKINEDWLTHFFERSRSYSDEETQRIWAKVLAGEANKTGSFSRRTIDMMASMDPQEAILFKRLCSFVWNIRSDPLLIVPNMKATFFKNCGLTFADLVHLDYAGLISFQSLTGFARTGFGPIAGFQYFEQTIIVSFATNPVPPGGNQLSTGPALLTRAGSELCKIVEAAENQPYLEHTLAEWAKLKIVRVSQLEASNILRDMVAPLPDAAPDEVPSADA